MNGLITRESKSKESYTRPEDEIIVAQWNDNKTVDNIVTALAKAGFARTKNSVNYRLRYLASQDVNSIDEIDYSGKKGKKNGTVNAEAEEAAPTETEVEGTKARAPKSGKKSKTNKDAAATK